MKIAVDARMIRPGSMHGIARYVYQLLHSFRDTSCEHQYFILVNLRSPLLKEEWPSHMTPLIVESTWISFREQYELPVLLRRYEIDLFHAPSFVAPLFCPCPMLMTIHDLNHLVLPQFYTPFHIVYYQLFVKRCIRKSKFIFTVSHFSKSEIVRRLQIDPDKIVVTYNGVSAHYQPNEDLEKQEYIRDLYELPKDFLLCLSNNKPHKNIHQLVRAYCFSNINIPLVLASSVDPSLIKIAEDFDKKHLLYFSRFIAEEHLPAVYSMARLFVFPSTYEGFGLPPLEALACGVNVIVARSASLPEIVGDNAIFIDPFDYQDIASNLEKALKIEDTPAKKEKRVSYTRKFSWGLMAEKTQNIYAKCLKLGAKS